MDGKPQQAGRLFHAMRREARHRVGSSSIMAYMGLLLEVHHTTIDWVIGQRRRAEQGHHLFCQRGTNNRRPDEEEEGGTQEGPEKEQRKT